MTQPQAQGPDQWLVRTAQNVIAGPYPRDQILRMVLDRHLGPHDEVCPSNSYWFHLHEHEEVVRFLGAEAIPRGANGEEVTQTETQTDGLLETQTVTELTDEKRAKLAAAATQIDDETTGIFTNRSTIRQPGLDRKNVAPAPASTTPPRPANAPNESMIRSAAKNVANNVERSSIAWGIIAVMCLLAVGIVYVVLQMLNSR